MDLNKIHNVYFLGIGGIGMSGLARYFKFIGKNVAGYDKVSTEITDGLADLGIDLHFEEDVDKIPRSFKDKEATLVVYTPAVPKKHQEYVYFLANGFEIQKRAAVLGIITKDTYCFAVAGTHGKTTTSAILAHILKETGTPITAFLGGVSENFNSNFLIEGNEYTVVEADEFDRSFLHLSPMVACITSIDADHLDIYGNENEMKKTFIEFSKKVKPQGKLFVKNGLPIQGTTFGIEDNSDFSIRNITITNSTYLFDLVTPTETINGVMFNKPGKHNLLNALAALAMATTLGTPLSRLARALASFKGIKRRFSYQINEKDLIYIDDYAHHPTEIDAVYEAVTSTHPNKRITVVFQPHLFSRTKDFALDFSKSLARFDEIILLDIYPAREEPIEGITANWLLDMIDHGHKQKVAKQDLPEILRASRSQVFLTLGAGDIGQEVNSIKKALSEKVC
ncbi:UDP-N-acetylmuramate--L-alanine ligase [Galbibacter pacificus]|uniref:UDP-N-acetylmuramate--L-alanine ligase n=1 Tax=Galbibacter pacificus TaxID=2996052 RepID=A0ABT6FMM9_9FLAO|nr:UDP-N-acetylmuramate--L-alanine ligase [Galbibacter pacificus]MDG3581044.1 UDP-N-acetylmuramate--L-alanine ligase [Galbibacter pacificus]MDG3584522.1 UDP-N-acetylmuramate--L-alanine ligase [Galbibacter pacificus]